MVQVYTVTLHLNSIFKDVLFGYLSSQSLKISANKFSVIQTAELWIDTITPYHVGSASAQ